MRDGLCCSWRDGVADALAPVLVAQAVQLQLLLRIHQRLQRGQFQRGERAVPGAVQCADDGDEFVAGCRHARIRNAPAAVVVAGSCADCATGLVPRGDAVVAGCQVGVTLLALQAWAWISHGIGSLPGGAAGDDCAGRMLPAGDGVFGERGSVAARICNALTGTVRAGDCAGGAIPGNDAEFVAVFGRAGVAWICYRVGSLQRSLLASNGAGGLVPAAHAQGLSVTPLHRWVKSRIGNAEPAIAGTAGTGDDAGCFLPAQHAIGAGMHVRHQQVVAQVTVLDRQPVETAPVAAGLDECQTHPCFPLQPRNPVHWAATFIARQGHAAQDVTHGL